MKKLFDWLSKNFKIEVSYVGNSITGTILRRKLSIACFVYIAVYLIFFIALPEYLNHLLHWHLMLRGAAMPLGFILVQLFLPLLLPWGKWLGLGAALYVAIWVIFWILYSLSGQINEFEFDVAATFFFNMLFFGIVILRCLAKAIFNYFVKPAIKS
jgi:hypothetical protein